MSTRTDPAKYYGDGFKSMRTRIQRVLTTTPKKSLEFDRPKAHLARKSTIKFLAHQNPSVITGQSKEPA
jgi:hypothetical protein